MMLIDSHCHIHDTQFFPEGREEVYRRAVDADVAMMCVSTGEADSREAVQFVTGRDNTWAVVGVHPHDAKDGWQDIGVLLSEKPAKVVGIGEIGLDYYSNHSPREVQQRALEEQLQWALDYHLPVSFHVREAYDDFWPIFDNFSGLRGVMHSFTDTSITLEQALRRGLYIGVNGISTFTKDAAQQLMFRQIPLEKMLLETDAPFLTPKPFRGKMNEPVLVSHVAQFHTDERNLSFHEVADATTANARELFAGL